MKIEIKHLLTDHVLFEGDFANIGDAVKAAVAGKADLPRAYLSGANLSGANLSGANLSGANLSRAYLSRALHSFASVSFLGHGECGRMLTAYRLKEGDEPVLQCGCFGGSFADLAAYIAKGEAKYRETRTLAMETVRTLLEARNQETTA